MEMTTSMSRDLKYALVDLERFAREITKGPTDQKPAAPKQLQRKPATGLHEDPMIPWIKGAMAILIVFAVGIFLRLFTQFS